MQFSSLNNLPNITSGDNIVKCSSLAIDSRGFPHVVWIEEKNGHNEVKYKFWDGLQWNFYNTSSIHISNDDIKISKYSLVLYKDKPIITFSTKKDSYSSINVAVFSSEWTFYSLDVSFNIEWISIVQDINDYVNYSSSSSSMSTVPFLKNYILTYGNNSVNIYGFDGTITLINQITENITSPETIKLFRVTDLVYGLVIGIIYNNTLDIKYNIFYNNSWLGIFKYIYSSQINEEIIDSDICPSFSTTNVQMLVGWISSSNDIKARHVYIDLLGNESIIEPSSLVKEEITNLTTTSNYYNGGFNKISITTKNDIPTFILSGSKNIVMTNVYGYWEEDQIYFADIENIQQISISYNNKLYILFSCSQGVYLLEESTTITDKVYPELYLMTDEKFMKTTWNEGSLTVIRLSGCNYDNKAGSMLYDSIRLLSIVVSEEDPDCASSSSTSSFSSSSSLSTSSSSSIILSNSSLST